MKPSEQPYPEHPCRLCDGFVQAGEDESKWGLDWYKGYVHFSCIENIFNATRRMRNKPEVAKLEAENERLKRNIYWSRMELEGHHVPWNGEFQFDHEQGLAWFVTKAELDALLTGE